jgi:hypothetical protein
MFPDKSIKDFEALGLSLDLQPLFARNSTKVLKKLKKYMYVSRTFRHMQGARAGQSARAGARGRFSRS